MLYLGFWLVLQPLGLELDKALLAGILSVVNNRATYQRQSWIPEAPTGEQALFLPTASDNNHPVPAIIEEHKLYFNSCIISLLFMQDPDNHPTWDICQAD